jgi:hypothetical protein
MNCTKIILENGKVLLGLCENDGSDFLVLKTRSGTYNINRSKILAISETNERFEENRLESDVNGFNGRKI